jgi:hypothetical protein
MASRESQVENRKLQGFKMNSSYFHVDFTTTCDFTTTGDEYDFRQLAIYEYYPNKLTSITNQIFGEKITTVFLSGLALGVHTGTK